MTATYTPAAIAGTIKGKRSKSELEAEAVEFDIVRLSDVQPQTIDWLWPARLPFGKIVVLEGDPGLGKSTLTIDWAARVTRGSAWPHSTQRSQPADVIFITYEDGVADTIRPRAEAADADCTRIHMFQGVRKNGEEMLPPTLPDDTPLLRRQIERTSARMVVIDTLNAATFHGGDSGKGTDMRKVLVPLARLAEETNCCIVILRHFTKAGAARAINAGSGSIDISGQARVVLCLHRDPGENGEDAENDTGSRILAVTKNNLARIPQSIAFHLEERRGASFIKWDGLSNHSADTLSRMRMDGGTKTTTKRGELGRAQDEITALLAAGPVAANVAMRELEGKGLKTSTITRAKLDLGVRSERVGGQHGEWFWTLGDSKVLTDTRADNLENLDNLDNLSDDDLWNEQRLAS